MPSTFPTTLDAFSTSHSDLTSEIVHALDINNLADAANKTEAFIGITGVRPVFDLVRKYGVSTSASATANTTAIHLAFADAALVGGTVYLRGSASFYPVNPLTLPQAPIQFIGDGPTASMLLLDPAATAGPILKCDPNGTPTSGPFHRISSDPAQAYDGNLTIVSNLGFNGGARFVSGVTGISIVNQSNARAAFLLDSLLVYGTWGTGIEMINSGGLQGQVIRNCCVYNASGIGFDLGSDMQLESCVAANTGYEGFRSLGYGTSLQIDNCKAFGCGTLTASRGIGLYLGSNGAGVGVTNFNAQDCRAEGVVIEDSGSGESHNITIAGLVCDSNSNSSLGTYSGLRLSDCHDVQVKGYVATDRFFGSQSCQLHGLKVTNAAGGNARNIVEFAQSPTDEGRGFPTLTEPVDPASDLTGTAVKTDGLANYAKNYSTAAQSPAAATRTYITGSQVKLAKRQLRVGTILRWKFNLTKTGAGSALSTFDVCFGTAGTTADTARLSFTKPAGTAVADEGWIEIECIIRGPVTASCVAEGEFTMIHNLAATGHMVIPCACVNAISAAFDVTPVLFVGVCITSGASDAVTIQHVTTEVLNL
jgi:hypothetical protein